MGLRPSLDAFQPVPKCHRNRTLTEFYLTNGFKQTAAKAAKALEKGACRRLKGIGFRCVSRSGPDPSKGPLSSRKPIGSDGPQYFEDIPK